MYFGCDLSIKEYAKDFELLGYTHEESIILAKDAIQWLEGTKELKFEISDKELERIANEFSRIGCTSFQLSSEEINNLLQKAESKTTIEDWKRLRYTDEEAKELMEASNIYI